jgi:EAL domain-containing protein (putative c-di-GMP-specific phosphodiesterase class I)/GGDEF domain-containing protein
MPRSREQTWEVEALEHLGQAKHLLSTYLTGSAGFFFLAILITYLAANFYVVRPIRENTARLHRLLPHGNFPKANGDELALLHHVVTQTQELLREHQALSARVEFEAHHDDIARLPNRRALNDFIADLENHSAVEPGVVLLHIRNLDRIQDQFGYRQADQALLDLSSRLDDDLPDNWYVFYLGHNRFLLIALGEPDLGRVTRRLIDHIATDLNSSACPAAAFLDLEATYISNRDFNTDLSTLFQYAAITLHQTSDAPDRVFAVMPEQIASFHQQLLMETHLSRAVERSELYLHYQPICRSDDIGLRYFEVLLRWHNPALGAVSPVDFIPIAETKGLISDIGRWIFRQACAQLATWDAQAETRGIRLSINVSPLQIGDANLASSLLDTLAEFAIAPRRLILEITESAALSLSPQARSNLETLRKAGIQLAIDDFGEGYSSLGQLLRLNADVLKIDRQFVATIDRDDAARAVIRGFIELARNLGMDIVAEGVENARQLELLRKNGCPGVQGYLVSRPLPPDLAIRWYLQICNFPTDPRGQRSSHT